MVRPAKQSRWSTSFETLRSQSLAKAKWGVLFSARGLDRWVMDQANKSWKKNMGNVGFRSFSLSSWCATRSVPWRAYSASIQDCELVALRPGDGLLHDGSRADDAAAVEEELDGLHPVLLDLRPPSQHPDRKVSFCSRVLKYKSYWKF